MEIALFAVIFILLAIIIVMLFRQRKAEPPNTAELEAKLKYALASADSVKQIHELLEIEQSTTSHHLGILKDKGVLSSKREGKNTFYFLKHNNLTQIVDCINKCC